MSRGKTFIGYQSGESATDSSYRRMGIWGKVITLGEKIAKERGIDFFFGFPAAISFGGFIKAGYQAVGTFDMARRIINPFLLRATKENKNENMINYNAGVIQNSKITPSVNSNYVDWRYHRNPKQYQIITYAEKNEISTFVVRQCRYYNKRYKVSFQEIQLVDFYFNSLNQNFLKRAFRHVDSLFSRRAVWISTFFNRETYRGKALSNHFNINLKARGPTLIFKKINKELDDNYFATFNNWDILPHVMDSY